MKLALLLIPFFLIGCSNGSSTTELATEEVQLGVRIGWDIPSMRENGDPLSLSEIKQYDIYITDNPNWIPQKPTDTVTENNYRLSEPGTYYVYVTTVDINNDSSPYSDQLVVEVK